MKSNKELLKMFEGCEGMSSHKAITQVMDKYKYTKPTAQSYYYAWKKLYMHGANCIPKEPMKIIDNTIKTPPQKQSFVDSILSETKDVKKSIDTSKVAEALGDMADKRHQEKNAKAMADMKGDKKVEEKLNILESGIVEENSDSKCGAGKAIQMNTDADPVICKSVKETKFKSMVLEAETFIYKLTESGLRIEKGATEIITQKCIDEQQAALKIWNQYYGV